MITGHSRTALARMLSVNAFKSDFQRGLANIDVDRDNSDFQRGLANIDVDRDNNVWTG